MVWQLIGLDDKNKIFYSPLNSFCLDEFIGKKCFKLQVSNV